MSLRTIHGKLAKTRSKLGRSAQNMYGIKPQVPFRKASIPEVVNPKKGEYMGLCNRTACQAPGPTWWNTGSHSYYCGMCAQMINVDGCQQYHEPDLCFKVTGFDKNNHPQFDLFAKKDYYAEYDL